MKKTHFILIIVITTFISGSVAFAASLAVKCPVVIATKSSKTYTLSKNIFVCFKSEAGAKKSGYKNEKKVKKTWKPVTSFSGSVDKTTDPFIITGAQWRIKWDYPGDAHFAIVVYDATKNEYKKLMVNTIGATNDSSNYYGAGSYYLDISAGFDWNASIEEYK